MRRWRIACFTNDETMRCVFVRCLAPAHLVLQALNHALLAYRTPDYRHLSTSPPGHSPLAPFAPLPSPNKRKLQDPLHPPLKRRRDHDDNDSYDLDPTSQGAKHWTDDEKSKLFTWLMGTANDDHWNALRATKNSCLREVCFLPLPFLILTRLPPVCRPRFWQQKDLPGPQRLL